MIKQIRTDNNNICYFIITILQVHLIPDFLFVYAMLSSQPDFKITAKADLRYIAMLFRKK